MGQISKQTCSDIWGCHREIEASKKLLEDLAKEAENDWRRSDEGKMAGTLKDHFGRSRRLELGIPSGDNGHRIFDVDPELAKAVIRAHLADKKAQLATVNERARVELAAEPAGGGPALGNDDPDES